jgi:hypothetical protein
VKSVRIEGLEPVTIGWAARRWAALPDVATAFVEIFQKDLASARGVPGLEILSL